MAKVIGDIMFPGGKYIKDGEEKTRWLKCGVLLETEKGMRIKLESMPVGIAPGEGWFSIFEKRDEAPKATSNVPAEGSTGEPDLPF